MLMLNKKKDSAATIIVSSIRDKGAKGDYPKAPDSIRLAAYELADAAGLHIEDMDKYCAAMKAFHDCMHEEKESNPITGDY